MSDLKTGFIGSFHGDEKSLGVRLDLLDNIQLFKTKKDIENLMQFLKECGIKFLNIGNIFSRCDGGQISSFAFDERILTPAVLDQDSPLENTADSVIKFFNDHKTQTLRAEFTKFCDSCEYWLEHYALFRILLQQTEINDFSRWPDILRVCHRKVADIIRRQLFDWILPCKIIQFFTRKQIQLIRNAANNHGIFLCADCDILCENLSAEIWSNQKAFFINEMSKATVFAGLPESGRCKTGLKTTKVPYRIGGLKNSNYEIFEMMFRNLQGVVDAIFLLNGHAIFQYWEIACNEVDPRHGRWVNMPTGPFFEYLDSHFNNFPFLFDFNEPLFPANEVISKRHNMLQAVIDGEPTLHSCDIYNLSREIFAISSSICDRKIAKLEYSKTDMLNATKSCLKSFRSGQQKLCVLHFHEICNIINCQPSEITIAPLMYSQRFVSFVYSQLEIRRKISFPQGSDGKNINIEQSKSHTSLQRIRNFFKSLFR
jgi:hypothetical protein